VRGMRFRADLGFVPLLGQPLGPTHMGQPLLI